MRASVVAAAFLGLLTFSLAACSGDVTGPDLVLDALDISIGTAEADGTGHLLLLDEIGQASVSASVDGLGVFPETVRYESTDPEIVSVRSRTAQTAQLIPHREGSARIVAYAGGLASDGVVRVIAAPLPVDDVRLTALAVFQDEYGSFTDADADYEPGVSPQRLVRVRLAKNESVALDAFITREGVRVTQVPYEITSSNPAAIVTGRECRPPEFDSTCGVASRWGWVTRVGSGTSIVTYTVRNVSVTFEVVGLP